jgi:hypothetical protein
MKNQATKSGISAVTILGLIFVTLKLTGHIDWSWWWATVPFWGGIALVIILLGIVLLIYKLTDKSISADEYAKKMNERNLNYIPKRSKFQERLDETTRLRDEAKKNRK